MKRALIPTTIRTEFGEVLEDSSFHAPLGANRDYTYVAGYSDLRRARDLAKGLTVAERDSLSADEAEAARGQRNAQNIQEEIRRCLSQAGVSLPTGPVRAKDVPTLPARLQWVRTTKVLTGRPDNTKEVDAGQNGYRVVTKADLGQAWFQSVPLGATERADGSYLKGDTVLMVCDAKDAARNAALNQRETLAQTQRLAAGPDVELLETKVAEKPVQVRSRQFKAT